MHVDRAQEEHGAPEPTQSRAVQLIFSPYPPPSCWEPWRRAGSLSEGAALGLRSKQEQGGRWALERGGAGWTHTPQPGSGLSYTAAQVSFNLLLTKVTSFW